MKIPGYAFWETFRKFQVAFCDDLQPVSLKFDLLFMRDIASKNIYVDLKYLARYTGKYLKIWKLNIEIHINIFGRNVSHKQKIKFQADRLQIIAKSNLKLTEGLSESISWNFHEFWRVTITFFPDWLKSYTFY